MFLICFNSLIAVLADQHDIRQWNACGLPRDRVSTENAILVMQAERRPLLIDPQEQVGLAVRFIMFFNSKTCK